MLPDSSGRACSVARSVQAGAVSSDAESGHRRISAIARFVVLLIRLYRRFISPYFPPVCRFRPTCSQYALEAIEKYGFLKGGWLGLKRVLKCHPLHPGGYDPLK